MSHIEEPEAVLKPVNGSASTASSTPESKPESIEKPVVEPTTSEDLHGQRSAGHDSAERAQERDQSQVYVPQTPLSSLIGDIDVIISMKSMLMIALQTDEQLHGRRPRGTAGSL